MEEDRTMYRRKLHWIIDKADVRTLAAAYRFLCKLVYTEGWGWYE